MCVNLAGSSPQPGADAPTTARTVGLPPRRGKYFLSVRKKVPKKASGTATTGKRLLLPILTAGLAMSRAMELGSFHQLLERARARLFPPSKWAGLFPSAAYRRSAPPQVALGRLKGKPVGMLRRDLAGFAAQKNGFDFFFCGWHYPYVNSAARDASMCLRYSCNTKRQRIFFHTLPF